MDDIGGVVDDGIDWELLFENIPAAADEMINLFKDLDDDSLLTTTGSSSSPSPLDNFSNPSPDTTVPSLMGDIEHILMNDDDGSALDLDPNQDFCNQFLSDILVDFPADQSGPALVVVGAGASDDNKSCDSNVSDGGVASPDEDNLVVSEADKTGDDDDDHDDDPLSKKRKRQLRNRDAAVRSRERKKMYVRDLELKSRYLEGECRRLGHLLHCCYAENQALRLRFHTGSEASGASVTKQESAVLLLESLLLGSLLWFLGIVCLFHLPKLVQIPMEAVPLERMENRGRENVAPKGAGSKMCRSLVTPMFIKSRRCKASRARMKPSFLAFGIIL